MTSIKNDNKIITLQPEVDERKNMFTSSLNKQIRHQAIDGELMPHINGWRLGSPISSRIGAPPETRPYRPMSSQNVRPDQVKKWISQRQNIENVRKKKRQEAIRMERRIAALECATYEMALNAQIKNQAYPAEYIPKPPPSVKNYRFVGKKLPSRNKKNRQLNSVQQRQISPKWEQGIIGKLLSKDEKNRCVLYGQRKHDMKAETTKCHAEKKVVQVNKEKVINDDDDENAYGENDFEADDDDDEDDNTFKNDGDKFEQDEKNIDNSEKKAKNGHEGENQDYENDDDFENDDENAYEDDDDFENEEKTEDDNNKNSNKTSITIENGDKNELKQKTIPIVIQPPRLFQANWFYNDKRRNVIKYKKKKERVTSHPYNWNHWKAPELLRVEKALEEYGPPNLLSISAIDKHFERLINKAKKPYATKKKNKFIYLKWNKEKMVTTYVIEYKNGTNEWVQLYKGPANSCLINAKDVHLFNDDNHVSIVIRSKSHMTSVESNSNNTKKTGSGNDNDDCIIHSSKYSQSYVCPIEKYNTKNRNRSKMSNAFPKVPEMAFDAPPSQFPIHNNNSKKVSNVLSASPLRVSTISNEKNGNTYAPSPYSPSKKQILVIQGHDNNSNLRKGTLKVVNNSSLFEI